MRVYTPPKKLTYWAIWIGFPLSQRHNPYGERGVFVCEYGGRPMLFDTKKQAVKQYGLRGLKHAKVVRLKVAVS